MSRFGPIFKGLSFHELKKKVNACIENAIWEDPERIAPEGSATMDLISSGSDEDDGDLDVEEIEDMVAELEAQLSQSKNPIAPHQSALIESPRPMTTHQADFIEPSRPEPEDFSLVEFSQDLVERIEEINKVVCLTPWNEEAIFKEVDMFDVVFQDVFLESLSELSSCFPEIQKELEQLLFTRPNQ